ncbi:MAG: TonB-dependent receptor [Pseudomonadales bacterium]|jgi:outer membrane receptor protein involved in Fe transport|nr:TonB-dependent receptor [Pseudomonadales bacterium]
MSRSRLRRAIAACAASAVVVPASLPALGEELVEEIVVTGSYIRRTTADSPSPLTVIDRASIEQVGAIEVSDIVNRMTFNAGSTNVTNAFSGGDNSVGQTNINLRNLGLGSTLVLLNGKRFVASSTDSGGNAFVNTATMMPSIAIQRVEVVKDGASALYGSDAIAGVVNFITRDDFDGLELSFDARADQESGEQTDVTFSGIWGASGERGSITASFEVLGREGLRIDDRYDDFGRSAVSTLGNPGSTLPIGLGPDGPAPNSTAIGAYVGTGGIGDLDCELAADRHRQSFRSPLFGTPLAAGSTIDSLGGCIYDFSPFFNLVGEETRILSHVSGTFDLSESMELYGEFAFSDQEFRRGNSLFPLVRFPFVPATNPGVQNDLARRDALLTAADSPLAGFLTTPGNVIGTTFFGRVLGFTPGDEETALRPVDTDTRATSAVWRGVIGTRGDLGDSWNYDFSVTRSERKANERGTDTNQQNLQLALNGLGGPLCNAATGTPGVGNCEYYNPYYSAFFTPDGSPQTDPALANSPDLLSWMVGEFRTNSTATQTVTDLVISGDLLELPNGMPLGMAVGAQWRRDEITAEADDTTNANGFSFIFGGQDWQGEENVFAAFVELAIPITDRLDLQFAGRYESFQDLDDESFDPKLTAMWRATDDLTLRASTGTSFRVGSLLQRYGFTTQLVNIADPFSGSGLAFRPEVGIGNEALKPESAFVWNVGLSWKPSEGILEGLSADLDYYSFQYDDLIVRPGGQELIAIDTASRCPQGLNDDPTDTIPDCGIQPDGSIISIGPGIPDQVIRAENGAYLRAEPRFANADELETSGMDVSLSYEIATDNLGLFTPGITASWTREYVLTNPDGSTTDGVGKRNINTTIGRSLPEWKANASLAWQKDRHGAFLLVRYIDSYQDDQPTTGEGQCVGSCLRAVATGIDVANRTIDEWITVDLQYAYELPKIGFAEEGSRISIGGTNIFNKRPPRVNFDGLFDPFVHDPRGAIWYARYTMQL